MGWIGPRPTKCSLPAKQAGFVNRLVVRTALDPAVVAPLIRAAFRDIDPQHIAVDQVKLSRGCSTGCGVAAPSPTILLRWPRDLRSAHPVPAESPR